MREFHSCDRTIRTPIQMFDVKRIHYITRAKHTHNGLELTYVTSGSAYQTIYPADGRAPFTCEVKRGNYYVLTPDTSHSYHNGSSDFAVINLLARMDAIDPRLTPESTEAEIENILLFGKESTKHIPFNEVCYDYEMQLGMLFEDILSTKWKKPEGMLGFYHAYVTKILLTILNRSNSSGKKQKADISEIIKEYVDIHFSDPLSLGELSEQFHYAQSYISNRFRQIYGCTFVQYLQKVRMTHACDMLVETNLTIEEVAALLSYSSQQFRRTFRKCFEMSPNEYRKKYKHKNDS